ncbi:hypothetical protein [Nocardia paucivorans]|uniref:hypothetical protein n=1 Tax=Nocardia paucivorans TaxID=114259 RepID=UPI00031DBFB3|nr:hypothetical protein [Nocardia paucivorans]
MAQYNVTTEVAELLAAGYTEDGITSRVDRITIYSDGEAIVFNRGSEAQIDRLLAEARRKKARKAADTTVAEGRQVQWRKVGHEWLLAGRELTAGDVVTVTRRDGSSSDQIVGDVVAVKDGVTFARPGTSASSARRDRRADRVARIAGLPAAKADGRCHYCGLPLNRRGYCDECS